MRDTSGGRADQLPRTDEDGPGLSRCQDSGSGCGASRSGSARARVIFLNSADERMRGAQREAFNEGVANAEGTPRPFLVQRQRCRASIRRKSCRFSRTTAAEWVSMVCSQASTARESPWARSSERSATEPIATNWRKRLGNHQRSRHGAPGRCPVERMYQLSEPSAARPACAAATGSASSARRTTCIGTTAVFLDPPYAVEDRADVYGGIPRRGE